ncbi:uncharacterized protein [Primulina huaijiensis]|uniref:uncharacterized protein n=1 Tax=Primulina huaijiensis TaxID=1492673 RepID=UPI003CC72CF1
MRIRKRAKISTLLYATSSLDPGTLPQAHICQLNQSPWDVMNFSPPPPSPPPMPSSQVNGNDSFAGNGSSRDSIAVIKREWMDELNKATKWEHSGTNSVGAASNETEQEVGTSPKDDLINMCCKTDGKSCQCRREAAKGNSLCEHHLIMVRGYSNNSAHSTTKNSEKSSVEARGGPGIKKRAAQSLSNPYVFYYYSGFGPRCGKKRGEVSKNINEEFNIPKNDLDDDNEASSSCDIEDVEIEDRDEYEDEVEKIKAISKKKARKPIKARSLKSLM